MKYLLIALIALTMTLGVGCKKEKIVEPVKKELTVKKIAALQNPTPKHLSSCNGWVGELQCLGCYVPK